MVFFDNQFLIGDKDLLAGCDEVGRGPLAGPVVACCVYYSGDRLLFLDTLRYLFDLGIKDSKKISEKKRKVILAQLPIKKILKNKKIDLIEGKNYKLSYGLIEISHHKIDRINILNASLLAMRKSFNLCYENKKTKGTLLVDGNKNLGELSSNINEECIIKGDQKSLLIGLASIIAKEYRDQLMKRHSKNYKGYGLEQNMGYPTAAHRDAISKIGPSPIHRKSFRGVKEYL